MRVSAKTDYALRAAVELAAHQGELMTADALARAQGIPTRFLANILAELGHAGIVESRRGPEGGHRLSRPADQIAAADVIRAIEGPLANITGRRPDELEYQGSAALLRELWVAVRANLRAVLERVTLAELAEGSLPDEVVSLTRDPDAWAKR